MKQPSSHSADDFEARLRQQPIRKMPQDWRAEILAAARSAGSRNGLQVASARMGWPERLSSLNAWASALLWPSPKAWAALALTWVVILVANHAATIPSAATTLAAHRPPAEMQMARREEERVLAELLGQPPEQSDGEKPRPSPPRPRSELTRNTLNA